MTSRFDAYETETIELLQRMISERSDNPPGDEEGMAELVCAKMRELGIEASIVSISPKRANVVGIIRGRKSRPALLLTGHLDTVPPGEVPWDYDPYGGEIVGDRLYGRGSSDMKAGIAAALMAAKAIIKSGIKLEGDLKFAFTAGEETDSLGAWHFLKSGGLEGVGGIVICEPSDMDVVIAEKGTLWLKYSTMGKTAHGAWPHLGVNAIMHMSAILNKLAEYTFSDYEEHRILGVPTLSVGTIAGGVKTNVVPDKCEVTVDVRTVPGQDHAALMSEFTGILSQIREQAPDFRGEVEAISDRPPVEIPEDEPLVRKAFETMTGVLGKEPMLKGVSGYTDAAVYVPATGIPMISCGPGILAVGHQPNEYVEIPMVMKAVEFYTRLIEKMLADS